MYALTYAAIMQHVASCDSTLACTAGNDACACCPHGAGEYNVTYDSAAGVCTVSALEIHSVHSASRPWTGKVIRDSEGLLFLACAILACGLLVRVVRDRHLRKLANDCHSYATTKPLMCDGFDCSMYH